MIHLKVCTLKKCLVPPKSNPWGYMYPQINLLVGMLSSVKQYLNAVRLVHLKAGFENPLEKNWYVSSILKGVQRLKGDASVQKLPITFDILKKIFLLLDLHSSFDRTFWAACLVGFLSFFRKSNLLICMTIL